MNKILLSDSYKASHWVQYPPNTETVRSYFAPRGGKWKDVVSVGIQYYLKEYFTTPITQNDINYADDFFSEHLGPGIFNRKGWEYILAKHNGWIPLKIKAVPEGTVVPNHNILMTVENTDPKCWWLTNYMETLLVMTWYPTTVATLSRECKKVIMKYLEETGDPNLIDFKLHDFGLRGSTSPESGGIGGFAHLVNFMGTDNIPALLVARKIYNEPMAGFSIPAAEHSTITSWGRDHEKDAMENMLDRFPTGLVAVVSDQYNIFEACEKIWGTELKDKILKRKGTLVIRPDSGDPVSVCMTVLTILGEKFGYTENKNGYKVLPEQVRIIQGDGVNIDSIGEILENLKLGGWSADNIAFGMGGGLLQSVDRDTLKFAFKCSSVTVDGVERDVYKEPITDPGKNSMKGRLKLVRVEGAHGSVYVTEREGESNKPDELVTMYNNGILQNMSFLSEIRERAKL